MKSRIKNGLIALNLNISTTNHLIVGGERRRATFDGTDARAGPLCFWGRVEHTQGMGLIRSCRVWSQDTISRKTLDAITQFLSFKQFWWFQDTSFSLEDIGDSWEERGGEVVDSEEGLTGWMSTFLLLRKMTFIDLCCNLGAFHGGLRTSRTLLNLYMHWVGRLRRAKIGTFLSATLVSVSSWVAQYSCKGSPHNQMIIVQLVNALTFIVDWRVLIAFWSVVFVGWLWHQSCFVGRFVATIVL